MNSSLVTVESVCFIAVLAIYLISAACYFVFAASKKENFARTVYIVMAAGFALHTLSIAVRGVNAGRLPLTNQFEFATAFSWGIVLCFLIFVKKYDFSALGTFVAPVVFLVMGYAAMQSRDIHAVMPALQSSWLAFHVCTAIIAYGSFGVSFGVAMVFLFQDRLRGGLIAGRHVPDDVTLDTITYRAVSLGFLFLTLCIITGSVWAKRAWGSYWSWDPKETWSLITWIIYAIYLHLRLNKGWKGKKAAVFAAAGFICVIFTYVGVNTLLVGLHSYK